MISVNCLHCGLTILVPPTVQGKRGVCFNCGQPLRVPITTNPIQKNELVYEPGARVSDRYTIEERIGKGGMGVVYKAQDTLIEETVALKFMNPKLLRTKKGQQLFIQEAQVARRLRHENIVAVHDVNWTADGILYLSMEFAKGQSLRDFLRQRRVDRKLIDMRLAVTITGQILAALEFAHRTVIHRDIKPENVMLLASEHVKVLDFGLAKAVHQEMLSGESFDKKQGPVGTRAYAAPEQDGQDTVDMRADLYAVGLVMHELLTLRTPLDEPVKVQQVRTDISPSMLHVLEKAIAPEKERRWQSAREFRQALEKCFNESYLRVLDLDTSETVNFETTSTEDMVYLEGGSFLMGSNRNKEEGPEEEVTVGPFWMDIYPVTVRMYRQYLEATGAPEPKHWRDPQYSGSNQPAVGVSWEEAKAYAAWAGKRLPTEAQWEFAARGKENRPYPWGALQPDPTLSNYGDHLGMPSIVTMHDDGRTPGGIFDMAGNVAEWTLDAFVRYSVARTNPAAALTAPRRVVRGGAWNSRPEELNCTARKGAFPETQSNTIGFRCVVPAKASRAATTSGAAKSAAPSTRPDAGGAAPPA